MRTSMKKLIVMLVLAGMSGALLAENVVDSTSVKVANIKPVIEAYLLAQGTASSNPQDNNAPIRQFTTSARCSHTTSPKLSSSLINTYQNVTYMVGGIYNTLELNDDYLLTGVLYMKNQGALGGDNYSPITVNWQVWCQPNQTA